MITDVKKIDDITKNLRSMIISQGEVKASNVINNESISGPNIEEITKHGIFSGDKKSVYIIFDMSEDINDYDIVEDHEDYNVSYVSMKMHLYLYGDQSEITAHKLRTRLLSEKVLSQLYSQGIYIKRIERLEDTKEIINERVWKRRDMDILFTYELKINNIDKFEETTQSDLEIIKGGD